MEKVERLFAVRNCLGEGALWNAAQQKLYWLDIIGQKYFCYHPATGAMESFDFGLLVSVMRFTQSGRMVMATEGGFKFWDPLTRIFTPIANPEQGKPGARFNDGAIDPQGRFWAGTMSPDPTSSLYRMDADLSIHKMDTRIGVSNGTGWSPDGGTMYFTDSATHTIYAYDFDPATGDIAHQRIFSQTLDEPGTPDGLAVDRDGFVWSASWGGWKVNRYDPDGKKEREIPMPVEFPTSCAFGGDDLTDLYITTAWVELGEERKETQPWAGDLFRLHTEIKGKPEPFFAGS